jgi:hypothetical protein
MLQSLAQDPGAGPADPDEAQALLRRLQSAQALDRVSA